MNAKMIIRNRSTIHLNHTQRKTNQWLNGIVVFIAVVVSVVIVIVVVVIVVVVIARVVVVVVVVNRRSLPGRDNSLAKYESLIPF